MKKITKKELSLMEMLGSIYGDGLINGVSFLGIFVSVSFFIRDWDTGDLFLKILVSIAIVCLLIMIYLTHKHAIETKRKILKKYENL